MQTPFHFNNTPLIFCRASIYFLFVCLVTIHNLMKTPTDTFLFCQNENLLLFLSTSSLLTSWWVCGPSITLCPFLSATPFSTIPFSFPASLAPPFLTSASPPHTLSRSASHYFYPPECGPAPLHANRKPQVLFCLDSTQARELFQAVHSHLHFLDILREEWREDVGDNYFLWIQKS